MLFVSFHKKQLQIAGLILGILLAHGDFSHAQCMIEKIPEKLFNAIKERSKTNKEAADYFSKQQKDILLLVSINSKDANRYLAKLSNIYLGESVNEIVAETITKKKKAIVPYLESALKEGPDCAKDVKVCASQAQMLLDLIAQGKEFKSEDIELKKYSKKEICNEMKNR